jgi:hypothetical protein
MAHLSIWLQDTLIALLVLLPAAAVAWVVFRQSKVVAAFAQLNGMQERDSQQQNMARKAIKVDRHWFVMGVSNVAFTAYILGAFPALYFLYFTPKVISLTLLRWWKFYEKKQHFLLWDFCYWANGLCLFYCLIMPKSSVVFQTMFMCANGPLAWSVLAFNHAMIFHSYAHVTSVVIHVSPLVLSYGLRWYSYDSPQLHDWGYTNFFDVCGGKFEDCQNVQFYNLIINALLRFYLPWLVLYYVWIFVALGRYIEKRSYSTLWDRILVMKPVGPCLKRMLERFPKLLVQGMYLLIHLLFSTLTFLIATILWYSQLAHFLFLSMIALSTVQNAAAFYFEVFESAYQKVVVDSSTGQKEAISKKLVAASATLGNLPPLNSR